MNHATVRAATPYGFLLPALVLTALVILFPVVQTIWYSVQDYILYAPDDARFIGFRNFAAAFRDEVFWISLGHSAVWVGGIVSPSSCWGSARRCCSTRASGGGGWRGRWSSYPGRSRA